MQKFIGGILKYMQEIIRKRERWLPILVLFMTSGIMFWTNFKPVLYADDWLFIQKYVFGEMVMVNFANRRPFDDLGFKLLFSLSRLNLKILFFFQTLLIFLCAVAVYFLLLRFFRSFSYLALPAALLFIVYPSDYSKMWITQGYTWVIYFLTLLGLILLVEFLASGRWWFWVSSTLLFFLPLFAYEAQIGLILAGSILIALLSPGAPLKRRIWGMTPWGIVILFMVWRLFIQPKVLGIHDPYINGSNMSVLTALLRLPRSFSVFFLAWTQPFGLLFPEVTPSKALIELFVLILLMLIIVRLLIQNGSQSSEIRLSWKDKWSQSIAILEPVSIGWGLMLAGFIPFVMFYKPNLIMDGITTRSNLFAIFGASLGLTAMLGLASIFLASTEDQIRKIMIGGLIPLMLIGVTIQSWNQIEANRAWRGQQAFWRLMFNVAPDLKKGTALVVVEDSRPLVKPFERLPLVGDLEVSNGIKVLYQNHDLDGVLFLPNYYAGHSGKPRFSEDGIYGFETGPIPYSQAVIVLYTPANGVVRLVRNPEKDLHLHFQVKDYNPDNLILPDPPSKTPYRYLVH